MPTGDRDRILTDSASAGARCLNNEKIEEGKAKRTANNECQNERAETRSQKALEEKKRLDACTVEKAATESEERVRNFVEQKRAGEEKLAEKIKKLAPGMGELGPAECACKAMSASVLAFRGQTIVGRSAVAN
jgi:hypothetical protein